MRTRPWRRPNIQLLVRTPWVVAHDALASLIQAGSGATEHTVVARLPESSTPMSSASPLSVNLFWTAPVNGLTSTFPPGAWVTAGPCGPRHRLRAPAVAEPE